MQLSPIVRYDRHMGDTSHQMTKAIEAWFGKAARDLPWRRRRTRWRSLVSEIMLQQTQVSRVVERFESFMKRFPNPKALAEVSEDDVISAWAGLGYYRRARNLQMAARQIVERHGGRVPVKLEDLLELQGVGRYTAGAIASIAGGKTAPIVDGNVHRVISRVNADPFPLDDGACAKRTWESSEELVNAADRPGVFNEGLMELGSQVCTKHSPDCGNCPLAQWCRAHQAGKVHEIPPVRKRPVKTVEHHHAVVLRRGKRLFFQQRSASGRWAGLWQLPTVESKRRLKPIEIQSCMAFKIRELQHIESFERVLTHLKVKFHVYIATLQPGQRLGQHGTWFDYSSEGRPALGAAQKQTLSVLEGRLSRL